MASLAEEVRKAIAHLREGAVQAADNVLSDALKVFSEAPEVPPPQPAAPVVPGPVGSLIFDLLIAIVGHLGNPATLKGLLNEIEAALRAL